MYIITSSLHRSGGRVMENMPDYQAMDSKVNSLLPNEILNEGPVSIGPRFWWDV